MRVSRRQTLEAVTVTIPGGQLRNLGQSSYIAGHWESWLRGRESTGMSRSSFALPPQSAEDPPLSRGLIQRQPPLVQRPSLLQGAVSYRSGGPAHALMTTCKYRWRVSCLSVVAFWELFFWCY
jgi:hypothetical protein